MTDNVTAAFAKIVRRDFINRIIDWMRDLSDDERIEVMSNFCRHCGSDDPSCVCWNDE